MAVSVGMLTTYPPTQCGLATFSHALVTHLLDAGAQVGVVRVVDGPQPPEANVSHQLVIGERRGERRAANALNLHDVAVVQHEYGIFGGRDGADVLAVLAGVRVPVISVLHTVLTSPTAHQRRVLAGVVAASSILVTMTETGRQRLLDGWDVDPERVLVIPHGAVANRGDAFARGDAALGEDLGGAGPRTERTAASAGRPRILTWGLIGPGKGIEWAVEAMAGLADLDPRPEYHVVGQTHPRVVEREGEGYREGLVARVEQLGLHGHVTFDSRYLDGPALRATVREADIVLLPYDSRDQVTSGVLTEAVVAGKPVVSTRFPHAIELLSGGAGLLVPQGDSAAIGRALRQLLTDPRLVADMARAARDLAPGLLWPAVASTYIAVADRLVAPGRRSVA